MINKYQFIRSIATIGMLGSFPAAGTITTFLALPCVYFLYNNTSKYTTVGILLFLVCFMISILVTMPPLKPHQHSYEIILGKFIGFITLFWNIPITSSSLLIGFALFRFFDGTKFGVVLPFYNPPFAWNILVQDFLVALYTHLILLLITRC